MLLVDGPHTCGRDNSYTYFKQLREESETFFVYVVLQFRKAIIINNSAILPPTMTQVNVRYMVKDIDDAVEFYTTHLGFKLLSKVSPAFADVVRGDLRLLLSGKTSSAGRPMPDGRIPEPGGWNRIELIVSDVEAEVQRLRKEGVRFRNEIVHGPGGAQILVEDPSGNLVELFQPAG